MRSPRNVTITPIGIPWRNLNDAIDFFALVITGFWPVMARKLVGCRVENLGVGNCFAHAHIEHESSRHAGPPWGS